MDRIVVVGGSHHNTLSMVRSIGKQGLPVDVILCGENVADSFVLKSKYIGNSYIAHSPQDVKYLLEKEFNNPIVIVCSDDVSSTLNSGVEKYMDKQLQTTLAKDFGFNVPTTQHIVVERKCYSFDLYPCIVKPLASIRGGKRLDICETEDDLNKAISQYKIGDHILIQELIVYDYEVVIDGVSVNNKVIIPGFVTKHRDILGGTSYMTTHTINDLPDSLVDSIKKIVSVINYEGLFGVELMVKGDEYFFVEINLRNDATTYSLVLSGVNLPLVYVKAKQGVDYNNEINNIRSINAMVETYDFHFVFNKTLSLRQWIRDLRGCECLYMYDCNDKKPFWVLMFNIFKTKIRGLISGN